MVYQIKTEKELKALQKPQKARRLDADLPSGSQVIDRLEKSLARLQAKITELETTNQNIMKRVFELESKIENLRGGKIMEKQVKTILEEFGGDIRNIADELARGDNLLSDELMSEMYIYILTTSEKDKLLNLENAKQTAIDYLSKKGMVK